MVKTKGKKMKAVGLAKNQSKTKTTKTNVAINVTSKSGAPTLSSKQGQTTVGHREVAVESIANGTSYNIASTFAIQPAISTYSHGSPIGKWLPGLAKEYDNYEFVSLRAHYVPVCSTLTPGLVILTYDPNPNTSGPATFTDARNAMCSVSGPVRDKLTLDLSSYVRGRKLLTRTRAVSEYALYDVGRLFVCTTSGDTSANVGYLEFEYVVRMTNPQSEGGTVAVETLVSLAPTYLSIGATGSDGTAEYFGTLAAGGPSKSSTSFTNTIANGSVKQGDTNLVSFANAGNRSVALSYLSANTVTHTISSGMPVQTFKFNRLGMWRVRATLPGNWQNFAMYGAEMLTWPWGNNPLTMPPITAIKPVIGTNGASSAIVTGYGAVRGFRTVDVSGTENDDLVLEYDEVIGVDDLRDVFAFSVGMRNESVVGENATGQYTYNSAQGKPRFEVIYLGTYN